MQYSYELRDRVVHSRTPVLKEMANALCNHVFLDKGRGPIETNYVINYYVPQILLDELMRLDSFDVIQFRREIFNVKKIPATINIFIYHKENRKNPVLILAGAGKKFISIPEKQCS